ncbi:MAG: 50S ribosomal protein L15 [Candidatus Harrisonbacteria bacterium CG10_big_fil_rev_8_21_14_0_10_42_17]|uniref:Large ribosomal subunit protein uL15 n=1 Tax=Candidatus Harrisonbacteria bacterium CG10_big_fil_rev_8_21_14_0_10_42_17 TaxID=1974584 RepID=A0A2M6WHT5_9BACT|nr:MAG: 50S ribosomal protein L15 [Candidatus Harrisonbacteria bacterium CG10_big_fil_rev_8_21_14_0_10_42_17]
MQLHTLTPKHKPTKKAPRIGRGGKRGTTSGRGTKGQKSRAGHRIRPAVRDLIQRLPKRRGFNNKTKSKPAQLVSFSSLSRMGSETVITPQTLAVVGLVDLRKGRSVKILNDGSELTKAYTFKDIQFSAAARKQAESSGSTIS